MCYGKQDRHSFALQPGELIQHTALFGRSGAGKTNVAFLLLRELSRHGIPFLVFDWKKNYRDLLKIPQFHDLVIYTPGREAAPFFFNPLIPPKGTPPKEWLKKLSELMGHAYFLGEGVMFVLQEAIDRLYWDFGVYESSGNWPTFRDLLLRLRSKPVKGREASWMESTLRAVGVLCFGAMDWVLNSGAHFPIEKLLKQKAVLELDPFTQADKTFLIEALLLWIHHFRMNEPGRERLKHVLLVEEAHHILLKKKQELIGAEAVTDIILREIREFGEAIVLLDQLPSLISKPALENSYTTIAMNLKEKGDVTAAAKAMLLESDEARYLGRLPVGWGIVKLQARWVKPFLVRFPLFHVKKGVVTDEQVKKQFLHTMDVETAAKVMSGSTEAMVRLARVTLKVDEKAKVSREPSDDKFNLTAEEQSLLKDVHENLTSPVTKRYTRLRLNPKKGTRIVSHLIDLGLLKAENIPTRTGHVRVFELTIQGKQALNLPVGTIRHGGLEHRYWVETITRGLEKAGLVVKKEAPLGEGKSVDVLAQIGGKKVGIEVETGESDWKKNVSKCFSAGLDKVVVAMTRPALARTMGQGDRRTVVSYSPDTVRTVLTLFPRKTSRE